MSLSNFQYMFNVSGNEGGNSWSYFPNFIWKEMRYILRKWKKHPPFFACLWPLLFIDSCDLRQNLFIDSCDLRQNFSCGQRVLDYLNIVFAMFTRYILSNNSTLYLTCNPSFYNKVIFFSLINSIIVDTITHISYISPNFTSLFQCIFCLFEVHNFHNKCHVFMFSNVMTRSGRYKHHNTNNIFFFFAYQEPSIYCLTAAKL